MILITIQCHVITPRPHIAWYYATAEPCTTTSGMANYMYTLHYTLAIIQLHFLLLWSQVLEHNGLMQHVCITLASWRCDVMISQCTRVQWQTMT